MTRQHVPSILIVEDESTIADVLADNLREEGFEVVQASDGHRGERAWRDEAPDLVVLDVMLPHTDGITLCRRMRERGDETPVLFLSAKGQVEDRVAGLEAGGDDYLPKPFHLSEFLLRVKAMLRRRGWRPDSRTVYRFGGHEVDFRAWTARLAEGGEEALGERELAIFRLLSARAGEVVSRDDILDEVWGEEAFPSSRTVDNFVVRLRRLFEPDPAEPVYLHTVWGVGYRFTPDGAATPADDGSAGDAATDAAEPSGSGASGSKASSSEAAGSEASGSDPVRTEKTRAENPRTESEETR